jgi:dienelactone hydrolase
MNWLALLGFLSLCTAAFGADSEWRVWKSSSGSKIEAKLISKTPAEIIVERRDGKQLTVKLSQLSPEDQAFLTSAVSPAAASAPTLAPVAAGNGSVEGLPATPGATSSAIPCIADPKWSYLLYLPKSFDRSKLWPVCFIMAPGGGDPRNMTRYILAAEQMGIIMALSNESKNMFDDSDLAMAAMVADVYSRLPILKNLTMVSGMSGGSRMAYLLAEREKTVAGILACGSGSGVYLKESEFRDAKLRPDTVVCSLMGASDYNRREAVESHKGFSKSSRLIWFPGSHAWAEEPLIFEGLAHVYGAILSKARDPELQGLRVNFSRTLLTWAKQQSSQSPFTTHGWCEFLADFPGDPSVRSEASALVGELAKAPGLARSQKAEKIVTDFTEKYLSDGDTRADKVADPSRQKEAEKKAAEFEDLPQAEILKRLGKEVTGG